MRERADSENYVFITCPACSRRIMQPFPRLQGPLPYVHRNPGHANCRIIVIPDQYGSDHEIHVLPSSVREQTFEEAIDLLMERVA